MLDPFGCGLSDKDVARKMAVSQEIYALANWKNIVLAQGQSKPFCQETLYLFCHLVKEPLILVEQNEVIAVSDVVPDFHLVLQLLFAFCDWEPEFVAFVQFLPASSVRPAQPVTNFVTLNPDFRYADSAQARPPIYEGVRQR